MVPLASSSQKDLENLGRQLLHDGLLLDMNMVPLASSSQSWNLGRQLPHDALLVDKAPPDYPDLVRSLDAVVTVGELLNISSNKGLVACTSVDDSKSPVPSQRRTGWHMV